MEYAEHQRDLGGEKEEMGMGKAEKGLMVEDENFRKEYYEMAIYTVVLLILRWNVIFDKIKNKMVW